MTTLVKIVATYLATILGIFVVGTVAGTFIAWELWTPAETIGSRACLLWLALLGPIWKYTLG